MGIRCANHVTPLYPQKLATTSPTGGGRFVGIVRLRTKATELVIAEHNAELNDQTGTIQPSEATVEDRVAGFIYLYVSNSIEGEDILALGQAQQTTRMHVVIALIPEARSTRPTDEHTARHTNTSE